MLYFKMYLATPDVMPSSSSFTTPERFPFVYSRANDRDAVFLEAGVHTDEVLPGFEEGIQGMRALGKRKLVVPASSAYGHEGITFQNVMRKHHVPPNSTLLFFVELAHYGKDAHDAHEERHEEL